MRLEIPSRNGYTIIHGHLAQLGAHILDVDGVRGSSPLVPREKQDTERCPVFCLGTNKGTRTTRQAKLRKVRWTFRAEAGLKGGEAAGGSPLVPREKQVIERWPVFCMGINKISCCHGRHQKSALLYFVHMAMKPSKNQEVYYGRFYIFYTYESFLWKRHG